jgi:hypothetical protein
MIIAYKHIQNSSAKVLFLSKKNKTKGTKGGRVRQGTGPTH